jgi:uncharacterized membrane protein
MNFPPDLLGAGWLWSAHALFAFILFLALWRAPWHYLKNSQDSHVLFGSYLALYLMWLMAFEIQDHPGLEFHFLLVTTLTLMFGWAFAIIGVSVAELGLSLVGKAEWASYSLNVLCNGVIPILFTYYSFRLIEKRLPQHFFVYIYVGAFLVSALAMLISRLSGMSVLMLADVYSFEQLMSNEYFFLLPVMMFPEAFLNGGIMTMLIVYRPHWVSSFNDDKYLRGK